MFAGSKITAARMLIAILGARESRNQSTVGETNDQLQNFRRGSNVVDDDRNPGIRTGGD
jgi:hypothetical protein